MESLGFEVFWINDRTTTLIYRISRSLYKNILTLYFLCFEYIWIKKYSKLNFDYIFVIRGSCMTSNFLKKFKEVSPSTKFIIYQWDSIKNNPNFLKIIDFFDRKLTFDRLDSENFKDLDYLPLFYIKKLKIKPKVNENEILFIGSNHGNRLSEIIAIKRLLTPYNIDLKYYIYISILGLIKRILFKKNISGLTVNKLKYSTVINQFEHSNCVLDLASENQTGTTIRVIEALAMKAKVITNNIYVKSEEFYHPSNIFIMYKKEFDANKLKSFMQHEFYEQEDKINSLKEWIIKIFT